MMKTFLLFCGLFFPVAVFAQIYPFSGSAPKLMKPDISKKTGDTTWRTSSSRIADQGTRRKPDILECEVMKKRNHLALFFYLTKNDNKPNLFSIQKKSRITIYFTDKTSLVLPSAVTDTAVLDATQKNTVLCWGLYNLNADDAPVLMLNTVASIKIETSEGDFNYEISENQSGLIAKELEVMEAH